jgi:hypothetical protein
MSIRNDIELALDGQVPEKTPLTFYSWMVTGDCDDKNVLLFSDPWKRLCDMGLGICHHCRIIKEIQHGVTNSIETQHAGNDVIEIHTKETPVGSLRQVFKNGWHLEYWIKTPQDYKILTWVMNNTELVCSPDVYEKTQSMLGQQGIAVILASRTPVMSINIDWVGTEQFCMDLVSELPELFELYEVRKKLFLEETKLIAQSPGKYVKWLENLTVSMLGPSRYGTLLMPIYKQCVPILESSGKRVMVHYDGALSVIADQIANAPFHIIDSLTEPPEGDMTYEQCRKAWPDKVFWANINVDLFHQPESKLRQAVIDKRNRAGKRGLAFEISEDMPANAQSSIPIVLDTLKQLS